MADSMSAISAIWPFRRLGAQVRKFFLNFNSIIRQQIDQLDQWNDRLDSID